MKTKLFVMAALLIAALSSCTKNKEFSVYIVENDTDSTYYLVTKLQENVDFEANDHVNFGSGTELITPHVGVLLSQGDINDPAEIYSSISVLTLSGDTVMHISPAIASAWELRENEELWEHNTTVHQHIYTLHITNPAEK